MNSSTQLPPRSRYLIMLVALSVTCSLTSATLVYRLINLGPIILPGGIFIFPLSYVLEVIITEVYGYSYGRQVVWATAICGLLFSSMIELIINMPTPYFWHLQIAYHQVLGQTLRFVIIGILGNILGSFINIYLIAKSKIILHGKKIWLRGSLSTSVGEMALTLSVYFGAFIGVNSLSKIFLLAFYGYLVKVLFSMIFMLPSVLIINYLHKKEKMNVNNNSVNLSPFRL